MKRLSWILTLPLLLVVAVVAVTNRQEVTIGLPWPLEYSVQLGLSKAIFISLFAGLLIGGLATWLSAGQTRRRARQARRRADELEREVAWLRRERDRAANAPPAARGGSAGLPALSEGPGQATEHAERSATGH